MGRLDEFAPLPHHARIRAFLIDFHKAAVANDVGGKNRCKLALHANSRRGGAGRSMIDGYRFAA